MKLLITGGCGFLGSNLAKSALAQGIDLYIFDNLQRKGAPDNLVWLKSQGKFNFIHGDIRNSNDVERTVKNFLPDRIFHLAGQVAMTTSIDNPRMDFEVNGLGTVNILEAIRKWSPDSGVIYSSTNKVYGDLEQYSYRETRTRYECIEKPDGFDEKTPLEFHSPYGCSKGCADQYILDYGRIFGINATVFRHSSMYGGRQFATHDQGWVGWFCQKALGAKKNKDKNKAFTISGSGKQVRDVLHADDMVSLYFKASEKIVEIRGETFNIGGGYSNSLSLLELFTLLESLTDSVLAYEHLPPRESDQKVFVADISKVKMSLNWQPAVSKRDGIIKMLEWLTA